ncbi:hypothetical protein I550_0789 [Mycobacterium intracellulare 1956]|uniref:Uncharacterized protein n=1 Tax=Mycobacterium intracellulare 1956 TaxID=1299331 RepID=X8CMR0_MYCIT|nr:hypothetical protein I550_0789 [Mycobacterium intracellulare 1956]
MRGRLLGDVTTPRYDDAADGTLCPPPSTRVPGKLIDCPAPGRRPERSAMLHPNTAQL